MVTSTKTLDADRRTRDLIAATVASLLDPEPIRFRPDDERGVRPVRSACITSVATAISLRRSLNRNAFLCGCLDFTERALIEHLIVGLGLRHGPTTRVSRLAHVIGVDRCVEIPPWLQEEVSSWMTNDHRAEVHLFHNHPASNINVVFDNPPIASTTDRRTLVNHRLQPFLALKAFAGGGRIRFWLGENGYVREFRTPDVLAAFGI